MFLLLQSTGHLFNITAILLPANITLYNTAQLYAQLAAALFDANVAGETHVGSLTGVPSSSDCRVAAAECPGPVVVGASQTMRAGIPQNSHQLLICAGWFVKYEALFWRPITAIR